jgi:hypothetical protein
MASTKQVFDFIDIEQGVIKPQDITNALKNDRLIFVRSVPTKDPYYLNADMKEIRENARQVYKKLAPEKEQ